MNQKYVWGVIALILIVLGVVWYQKSRPARPAGETGTMAPAPTPSPTPATGNAAKKTTGSQFFTYEETVERYINQRIQFDANCLANPTSVTFKSGTQVMFDNRGGVARVVSLDGTGYLIGSYGYVILPLSSQALPHTIKVDCGPQKNVAQILLQK